MSWVANRGDDLISKYDKDRVVTYLADSSLNKECFIGETEEGDIFDDWVKNDFIPYNEYEEN